MSWIKELSVYPVKFNLLRSGQLVHTFVTFHGLIQPLIIISLFHGWYGSVGWASHHGFQVV